MGVDTRTPALSATPKTVPYRLVVGGLSPAGHHRARDAKIRNTRRAEPDHPQGGIGCPSPGQPRGMCSESQEGLSLQFRPADSPCDNAALGGTNAKRYLGFLPFFGSLLLLVGCLFVLA